MAESKRGNRGSAFTRLFSGSESDQPSESATEASAAKPAAKYTPTAAPEEAVEIQEPDEPPAERPVWLCVYNPEKATTFGSRIVVGKREEWRINPFGHTRLQEEMSVGDTIAIWRTRGGGAQSGIVATGEVSDLSGLDVNDRKLARIEFEITSAFPDNPFPRDKFLSLIDFADPSWPQAVSLKRLDEVEARVFRNLSLPPKQPTSDTGFSSDRPQLEWDLLNRAPLAFTLAHKINEMWGEQNSDPKRAKLSDQPAFTLHIDAPWGGGKTTFANYVARFLNPEAFGLKPAELERQEGSIFHNIEMEDDENWPPEFRERKWIPVSFNAWRHQHVSPPWWDLYEVIRTECRKQQPWFRNAWLWAREASWRVFTPARLRVMVALVMLATLLLSIVIFNVGDFPGRGETGVVGQVAEPEVPGNSASSAVTSSSEKRDTGTDNNWLMTALVAAFSGAAGIAFLKWMQTGIQNVVNSVGESTDSVSLGESDPLRRFRDHFASMIRASKQPVLVVIDDVDRCDAAYVVELVRGILTVFQSPRVVFVLLGDRAWIETAFSKAYEDMQGSHSETDISFGRRFVEKAIQVSFVLPEPDEDQRSEYVDSLLLKDKRETVAAFTFRNKSENDNNNETNVDIVIDPGEETDAIAPEERTKEVVRAAADRGELEDDTRHVLSALKDFLPDNPRRMKRIINTITLYQASALTVFGTRVQSDDWYRLVPWVLLMSEYPRQWQILCRTPRLAERIIAGEGIEPDKSDPDHIDLTALWSKPIQPLLTGGIFEGRSVSITSHSIARLSKLTPDG